jgi:transposase
MRHLTDKEVEELVEAYRQGDSVYKLGRKYGIHRITVAEHLRRHGIVTRVGGRIEFTPGQKHESAALYTAGWSIGRVATRMGVSYGVMRRVLEEAGVEFRKRGSR